MRTHIDAIHKGVKYQCKLCSNQFTEKSSLGNHMRSVHEGIKFSCHLCNNKFTSNGSLKAHMDTVHNGIKFMCEQCDYPNIHVHIVSIRPQEKNN